MNAHDLRTPSDQQQTRLERMLAARRAADAAREARFRTLPTPSTQAQPEPSPWQQIRDEFHAAPMRLQVLVLGYFAAGIIGAIWIIVGAAK